MCTREDVRKELERHQLTCSEAMYIELQKCVKSSVIPIAKAQEKMGQGMKRLEKKQEDIDDIKAMVIEMHKVFETSIKIRKGVISSGKLFKKIIIGLMLLGSFWLMLRQLFKKG